MNEMNRKKLYIWRLAVFLNSHGMRMSAEELAEHLNRNNFMTSYGEEYKGGRGTHKLIQAAWRLVHDELGLEDEAEHISKAFVTEDGTYPYE
jgi:hypothetical protein